MAMKCMNCGKGVMYGHNVSHAKNRTAKTFKPNLHSARIKVGTQKISVKLCTKCLRVVKAAQKSVIAESQEATPVVTA